MVDYKMVAFILIATVVFTFLAAMGVLAILHKTRYWQRVSGECRTLDLGEFGRLELTYTQNSYDGPELRIQHFCGEQPLQCEWHYWSNTEEGERSAYETMVSAGVNWGMNILCELYRCTPGQLRDILQRRTQSV